MGRRSKAKGKRGESSLKDYLESHGWTLADKETQGLAGDDYFAESPEGVWFSIECKHVESLKNKHYEQAREQAANREIAIKEQLQNPRSMASRLGITFDKKNWLLVWKPSGYNNGTDFVVFSQNGRKTKYAVWE